MNSPEAQFQLDYSQNSNLNQKGKPTSQNNLQSVAKEKNKSNNEKKGFEKVKALKSPEATKTLNK